MMSYERRTLHIWKARKHKCTLSAIELISDYKKPQSWIQGMLSGGKWQSIIWSAEYSMG